MKIMWSLICTEPGTFEYKDLDVPVAHTGETILKIRRIGICGTDLHAFEGTQPFFSYPRILGHELAAEIESTDNPAFIKGEAVTIIPYFNCGHCIACINDKPNCCAAINVFGVHIDGGMREYISVPSYSLVKSGGLSLDELAVVEPLAIAAHGVRRANVKPGEFVLVTGTGPIGIGIIEFAQIAGAHVIAMDVNEQRLNFCKKNLGCAYYINPLQENTVERLKTITHNHMPTVIIDATGNLNAINNAFLYLAHGGRYVLVGLQKENISFSHTEFHKRESTLMSSRNATRDDFNYVIDCLQKKLIDPATYITHRVGFTEVKDNFESWLYPSTGVIKAMVDI